MTAHVRDVVHLEEVIDRFTAIGQATTSIVQSSPVPRRAIDVEGRVDSGPARSTSLENPPRRQEEAMRFMVFVPGSPEPERGEMPSTEQLAEMTKYNEELVKAGVMLAGDGLHPTSKGAKVRFEGQSRTVIDGPFTEAKEIVAGYWIWEVPSREEAIEWLKRAPFDDGTEIELRQVFELDDFSEQMTPELREANERLDTQPGSQH